MRPPGRRELRAEMNRLQPIIIVGKPVLIGSAGGMLAWRVYARFLREPKRSPDNVPVA